MSTRLPARILVVDVKVSVTGFLGSILSSREFEVLTAHSFHESIRILSEVNCDLVITDYRLSVASGIDLITHIKRATPATEALLLIASGDTHLANQAIKRGAFYYLEKPCTPERLLGLVERSLEFAALRRENESLRRTLAGHYTTFATNASSSTPEIVIPPLVTMSEIEREAIVRTLERTAGNVKKSAQILRFPRPTFYRKLKKLGIKVERSQSNFVTKRRGHTAQ